MASENLATIAGVMKDCFDRTYYPVLGGIERRPYAHSGYQRRLHQSMDVGLNLS